MNKRTHIIYLIIILGFITAWFFENQISGSEPTAHADTTNFIKTVDNQPELLSQEAEMERSEAGELLASDPILSATIEGESKAVHEPAIVFNSEPTPDMAALLQQQVTDYTTQYYEQGYNAHWSYVATQQLTDLFTVHAKELEKFNVLAIECKSSICQIKTHVDGQPFMALMHLQKLLVEQGWYDASGETTMTIKSDGEPHEIYIAWGG